ncbi:hypothetical protein ACFXOL_14760 [Streptomyces californicus]|uniref:hypothetical protein n=1 Tax=Streptomyces californicus TaxID=67351 RepID=UPI0036640AC0
MNTYEPAADSRAAANRAAVLASIARRRTALASPWSSRALLVLADLLDTAARAFFEDVPAADGIPVDANYALAACEVVAFENPGTGFPLGLAQYVTHAVTRRPLVVITEGDSTTADDAQLVTALETLHGYLAAAATEDIAQALLEAVFALYDKRASLSPLTRG